MGLKPNGNAAAAANIEAARLQHDAAIDVANIQSNNAQAAARINSQAALEAARIGSSTALQAAGISAAGSVHAASVVGGATRYAADRVYQSGAEAAERSAEAGEQSLIGLEEQFNLANERLAPAAELYEPAVDYIANASTLEGFLGNLADISQTSAYRDLYNDRMLDVSNYASQRGMGRSGAALRAAAEMGTQTQLGIDSTMYGRNMDAYNIGAGAVNEQNRIGGNYSRDVTNTLTGTAASQGAFLTNAAANAGQITVQGAQQQGTILQRGSEASAQGVQQAGQYQAQGILNSGNALANGMTQSAYFQGTGIMGAANAQSNGMVNAANAQYQADQNSFNNTVAIAGTIASFFSDERLKENMQAIGNVCGLTLYEWDWLEGIKGLMGTEMGTGFSAQEVQEKLPDFVEDSGGMLRIRYQELLDYLKTPERLAA